MEAGGIFQGLLCLYYRITLFTWAFLFVCFEHLLCPVLGTGELE